MAPAPYEVAIARVKKLFKERNDPGWWSDNIIDASRDIPADAKQDWALFYRYITGPQTFDPNAQFPTLDDLTDPLPGIPRYEDCMEVIEYKNGPGETFIHVKRKDLPATLEDDEKTEEKTEA